MTTSSTSLTSASTSSVQPTPSPFPPGSRYEIRPLTSPTHALWTTAIVTQSQVYKSPVMSKIPPPSATRFDLWLSKHLPIIQMRVSPSWPLNFGVFDLEYEYSTEEAREAGGKFYWDTWLDEESKKRELETMTLDQIVERMDFPLVAVALSSDRFTKFDMTHFEEFRKVLPKPVYLLSEFGKRGSEELKSWAPTAPGQLIERNATSTKLGYEGKGLAKKLTYYLTDEARREGVQRIIVSSANPVVTHILLNTPSPASARVVAAFESDEVMDVDGKPVYEGIKETMSLVVVDVN